MTALLIVFRRNQKPVISFVGKIPFPLIIIKIIQRSQKLPLHMRSYSINMYSLDTLKECSLYYSVGTALGYGPDDRGSRFRFPAGAGNFSLHHRVQNSSGAHPASYPMGTRDSFPGGKAAVL
jgi:hypothetical protein